MVLWSLFILRVTLLLSSYADMCLYFEKESEEKAEE